MSLRKSARGAAQVVAWGLALSLASRPAGAQLQRDSSTTWLASAGSESEQYLRTLQVAGLTPWTQWSVRPFSSREIRRLATTDSGHPWSAQLFEAPSRVGWMRAMQPELTGIFNSRFPYGSDDGPLWAGRGPTVAVTAGVEGGLGPIEFVFAPTVFRAENWSFEIAPNGHSGPQAFADPVYPNAIDLPQRFGEGPYQRVDPGQSRIQLRMLRLLAGVTTANEEWGPAIYGPFLLSRNAAGFPHAFVGTDNPSSLGPVQVSARIIAGRLDQSPFAPTSVSARRYLTGVVAVVSVRQLPGLEIGGARLFHNAWPDTGLRVRDVLTQLLKNPFKARLTTTLGGDGSEPDNQIASIFARWVVPGAGLELYGEMGREDNAFDMRDLLVEPDRDASYSLGFQRVWRPARGDLLTLRGEVLNSAASHLSNTRPSTPPYVHTPITQGHTHIGQVLGAPGAFGGGADVVALEWLTSAGRRTITWRRFVQEPVATTAPKDVVHALTLEWLLFRQRVDLAPEATIAYELNRIATGDALNVRVALTGRLHW